MAGEPLSSAEAVFREEAPLPAEEKGPDGKKNRDDAGAAGKEKASPAGGGAVRVGGRRGLSGGCRRVFLGNGGAAVLTGIFSGEVRTVSAEEPAEEPAVGEEPEEPEEERRTRYSAYQIR